MIIVKELKEKIKKADYDISSLSNEELELFERISQLNQHKGKLARHFKGKFYMILEIVEHTETGDELVIYKAMYDDYKKYARPIDMFLSKVDKEKHPTSEQEYRFQFIELN